MWYQRVVELFVHDFVYFIGAENGHSMKEVNELVEKLGYGLRDHVGRTTRRSDEITVDGRQVVVVGERVDVELTGKELEHLVQEGLGGQAVAGAIAELDMHVDFFNGDGDVEEPVLLDPFDEVMGVASN